MTASGGYRGKKKTGNTTRFGGNGIPLQTFTNGKSQSTYNPHLIKKQQEVYRNAKLIRKFKKSVKQQDRQEDCVPPISIPELAGSSRVQNKTNPEIVCWKKNEKKNKGKNSLQSAREEYEKTQKEEEKARAERERIARAREGERSKAEGKRKTKRKMMLMKTQSGQPIMKYRIEQLLHDIHSLRRLFPSLHLEDKVYSEGSDYDTITIDPLKLTHDLEEILARIPQEEETSMDGEDSPNIIENPEVSSSLSDGAPKVEDAPKYSHLVRERNPPKWTKDYQMSHRD